MTAPSISFDPPPAGVFGGEGRRIWRAADQLDVTVRTAAVGGVRYLAFAIPPQHVSEQAVLPGNPAELGTIQEPARPSLFVFEVPGALWPGVDLLTALTDDQLLDWSQLTLVLHPAAAVTSAALLDPAQRALAAAPPGDALTVSTTGLWLPSRLMLSGTDQASWEFPAGVVTLAGRSEVWSARLSSGNGDPVELRAIWAQDFEDGDADPTTPTTAGLAADPFTGPDRRELVSYTGRVPVGHAGPPAQLLAENVTVAMTGGSADLHADLSQTPAQLQQLARSIRRGRDQHAVTATREQLHLWGHRVLVTKRYDRGVAPQTAPPVAAWREGPTSLRLLERTVTVDGSGQHVPGTFPPLFHTVTVLNTSFPDVEFDLAGRAHVLDAAQQPGTGAAPHGAVVQLHLRLVDSSGNVSEVSAPLVIEEEIAPSAPAGTPPGTPWPAPVTCAWHQQRVHLMPSAASSESTTFETDSLTFVAGPPAPGARPGHRVSSATVRHPALQRLATTKPTSIVVTPTTSMPTDPAAAFATIGHPGSGAPFGIAWPPASAAGLNRTSISAIDSLTVAHGAIPDPAAPASMLAASTLLGFVPLSLLGVSDVPTVTSTRTPQALTTTLAYAHAPASPSTASFAGGAVVFSVDSFDVQVTSTRPDGTAGGPPSSVTLEHARGVQLAMAIPVPGEDGLTEVATVDFDAITFTEKDGQRPSLVPDGQRLRFEGPLRFVQDVLDLLPPDLFSNPPQLTVADGDATLSYVLGLPDFAVGVFSLTNVTVDAAMAVPLPTLDAPADPASLIAGPSLTFGLAAPDRPFNVAVDILGGGGWFDVALRPGEVAVDAGIDISGTFSFDIAIASGGVSLSAGLRLRYDTDHPLDVGGFVHLSGGVEVLDLASVSLDVMLELDYQPNEFTGTAEVSVRVSLMFFHKSFSWTTTQTFAGNSDDAAGSADSIDSADTAPLLPGGAVVRPAAETPAAAAGPIVVPTPTPTPTPRPSPGTSTWRWDDYARAFAPSAT